MTIKIPDHRVVVFRDGKRQEALAGKPFDFTADELKDIEKVAGPEALRDPVNEAAEVAPAPAETKAPAPASAAKKAAPAPAPSTSDDI